MLRDNAVRCVLCGASTAPPQHTAFGKLFGEGSGKNSRANAVLPVLAILAVVITALWIFTKLWTLLIIAALLAAGFAVWRIYASKK